MLLIEPHTVAMALVQDDTGPMWKRQAEVRGLDHFLDAVRFASRQNVLTVEDQLAFAKQLRAFSLWQRASKRASRAAFLPDMRGTFYDLQIAAASAFLGGPLRLICCLRRSRFYTLFDGGRDI